MELRELIKTFQDYYQSINKEYWLSGNDQFILPLPSEEWNGMLQRNPTVEAEVRKLNSSTSLAINYHQFLSEILNIPVHYEVPIAIPLILDEGKGHDAMIDVKYTLDNVTYYIESKFLEPYYSGTHKASSSYFVADYYEPEAATAWVSLFIRVKKMTDEGSFKYYDINQMLKHLLAIYRTNPQGQVVLSNLIWKPTEAFYAYIDSRRSVSYLKKRIKHLEQEMQLACDLLNGFCKDELHWEKITIAVGFYNDSLEDIKTHRSISVLKEKYLMD